MEQRKLNVLVADSDVAFINHLKQTLASDSEFPIEFRTVSHLSEALSVLPLVKGDGIPLIGLILLGFTLKDGQGLKVLEEIRAHATDIPIIVLPSSQEMALAIESIKLFAQDYIIKEKFTRSEAINTMKRVLERQRIFHDWKEVIDEKFVQATRDPLTNLPNRLLFQDRLRLAISEAKRWGQTLGIFFIDLDHFKEINDRFGHDVGDQVLVQVGHRLEACIRSEDTVARVGGDEFVGLVRHLMSPEQAIAIAKRLTENLKIPFGHGNQQLLLSASIGISLFPHDADGEIEVLKNADSAMFCIKRGGGGGYAFYDDRFQEWKSEKNETASTKPTILIVEDDEDFQQLLSKRLLQAGYSCTLSRSVEDALGYLEHLQPDLIILDLGFRQASGIALLQNLSRYVQKENKLPPVLVVSGYSDPEIISFATTLGAEDFMTKPINESQFLSKVRTLIH
jgi:diguanylate cyclase (GGDEF)-like protein